MKAQGYCHFNDDDKNTSFRITVFGRDLCIQQDPGGTHLGHGAVVWDAAVVLVKYMEKNARDYDMAKLAGKSVIELGSGCGLGGLAFTMKGAKVTLTDLACVTESLTEANAQAIFAQLTTVAANSGGLLHRPAVFPIDWTDNPICKHGSTAGTPLADSTTPCPSTTPSEARSISADAAGVGAETAVPNPAPSIVSADLEFDKFDTFGTLSLSPPLSGVEIDDVRAEPESAAETISTTTTPVDPVDGFDIIRSQGPYDYVLLTDCVFSPKLARALVNTILCCCGPRTTVICCHEIRDEEANAAFLEALGGHFSTKRVPPSKLDQAFSNDLIEIIIAKPLRKKK